MLLPSRPEQKLGRNMTYDELNSIILRGDPNQWLSQERWLIYKRDLNLRIEMADHSGTGDSFHADWTENFPAAHPATRQVFFIHYGSTPVMDVHTVNIDQRTTVPLPDSDDHASMSAWNYGFGKTIEAYRANYGSIYSLDAVLERAGISVRGH
jgi:hypothetical protein